MSNHSPLSNDSIAPSPGETDTRVEAGYGRLTRSLKVPLQFCCFWTAIALPFVHVPLLANGLGDPSVTFAFLALLFVNVIALYVGHGYNQ